MQKGSVHFIGIGGAGMSAIAAILAEQGVPVSGSDLKESRNTQRLAAAGARIFIGHRPANVEGADLVVYSSAIRDTNKEMVRAHELGLEIIPRAMMLARLMAEREGIAVAGTHGKTTTTSMLAKILCDAGWDPTFIVGGELNDIAGNARTGRGPPPHRRSGRERRLLPLPTAVRGYHHQYRTGSSRFLLFRGTAEGILPLSSRAHPARRAGGAQRG